MWIKRICRAASGAALPPVLAAAGLLLAGPCRAEPLPELHVSTTADRKIDFCLPCSVSGDRFVQVSLQHMTDPAKRTDLWRLTRAFDVERRGDSGFADRLGEEIVRPGEWECAIRLSEEGRRTEDDMGGFHGYELLSEVKAEVDGKRLDLSRSERCSGRVLLFEQRSVMYLHGTDRPRAKHLKRYRITAKGIELLQRIEWLADTRVETARMPMLPVVRSQRNGRQITDRLSMEGDPEEYDVSRTDRNLKVGGDGVEHVKIWGRESGVTAEVTVRYEPELPGRRFFCSMYSPNYNKLYFDFCSPRDVKKGEKWKIRTTYILDIIR